MCENSNDDLQQLPTKQIFINQISMQTLGAYKLMLWGEVTNAGGNSFEILDFLIIILVLCIDINNSVL